MSEPDLLPQYYYLGIAKCRPEILEQYVRYNQNFDEVEHLEVLTAFSYYEALSETERERAKAEIAKIQIADLLTFIGNNNEILLQRIELLYDKGIPVIPWIENQLIRGKAMVLTFDQLIIEGKKYD